MGDEANDLTGVWVLRSAHHERVDTGEKLIRRYKPLHLLPLVHAPSPVLRPSILTYGDKPRGVILMRAAGWRRSTPRTNRRRPPPVRKLLAYSGRYRIENGRRFVTDVDVAWLPNWVGTSQGRNVKVQGDKLDIVSDPVPLEFLDGAMATGILSWVREER